MNKERLLIFLLLLCSACTMGDDYKRPDFYSDERIAEELKLTNNGAALPKKWYRRFNDKQLQRLLDEGLKNSPDIQSAKAKLRSARAELEINRTEYLPQIGIQGGYNYQKSSRNIKMSEDSHYYSAGFDASWELDIWGQGRRKDESSAALLKAEEYNLKNVKTVLAAEIITLYVEWCQSSEKLRLARQNLKLQEDLLKTVISKYENGLTDAQSYNEAEYLRKNTEAQIPVYEQETEQYKNALAVAIGILPSELGLETKFGLPLFRKYYKDESETLHSLPASVIRLRPDVAASEQQLVAENALIGEAVAELYPAVSISGLWGFVSQGGSKLLSSKSQNYNYEPLVTLPLLDWNRLQRQVDVQKYLTEEALAAYKKTVVQAVAELKSSLSGYKSAIRNFYSLSTALQNMRQAAEAVNRKYENGLTEFSEVLKAQQNLINAQEAYTEAQAGINKYLIAYYKAAGVPIIDN